VLDCAVAPKQKRKPEQKITLGADTQFQEEVRGRGVSGGRYLRHSEAKRGPKPTAKQTVRRRKPLAEVERLINNCFSAACEARLHFEVIFGTPNDMP